MVDTKLQNLRQALEALPQHPLLEQALRELAALEWTCAKMARATACLGCGGKGTRQSPHDGPGVFNCSDCFGSGVEMKINLQHHSRPGWKLHHCPDGVICRDAVPGGCASGYCGHFGVRPDHLWPNITAVKTVMVQE